MLVNGIIFPLLLVVLCFSPALVNTEDVAVADKTPQSCGALGDCLSSPVDCHEKCGCDRAYYYNETTEECVLDLKRLLQVLIIDYDTQEKLRLEADKVFKGIIVSVLLFITCAILCVFSACVYCIRMNYTDRVLNNDVKALAKKLHRDQPLKKSVAKPPRIPKEESCNVMVEEAGIFVV